MWLESGSALTHQCLIVDVWNEMKKSSTAFLVQPLQVRWYLIADVAKASSSKKRNTSKTAQRRLKILQNDHKTAQNSLKISSGRPQDAARRSQHGQVRPRMDPHSPKTAQNGHQTAQNDHGAGPRPDGPKPNPREPQTDKERPELGPRDTGSLLGAERPWGRGI